MIEYRVTCDHCKSPPNAPPVPAGSLVTLMMGTQGIHVCTTCIPALADFFPNIERSAFARYVSYEVPLQVNTVSEEANKQLATKEETVHTYRGESRIPLRVPPNAYAHFITWPSHTLGGDYAPSRFVIDCDRPEDWLVSDIKIGNRSQFSQSGDVPGDQFSPKSAPVLNFEQCHVSHPIGVIVKYIGKNPEGAMFSAHFEGRSIGFPPSPRIVP